MKRNIALVLSGIIPLFILWYFLGSALIHPDQYVYAFGGDAAIMYYNIIWHSWYGKSLLLENMNYPIHESIFMTACQASLSNFFALIHTVWENNPITNHIVGSVHSIHYLMIAGCSILYYKILRHFNVAIFTSILFAILITFLSPQMLRFQAGHFGTSYPIVFAGYIYLFLRMDIDGKNQTWTAIFLFLFSLWFGFNSIYLVLIGGGFTILAAVALFIANQKYRNQSIKIILPILLAILCIYFTISFTSPEMDRVQWQWGYFANNVNLTGLFHPAESLPGKYLGSTPLPIEKYCYLGITNIIFLLIIPVLIIRSKLKNWSFHSIVNVPVLLSLSIASFLFLIYASSLPFKPQWISEILGERLSILTMFKASGRFAWPFYSVLSILSVICIDRLAKDVRFNSYRLCYLFIIIPSLIWIIETHHYLKNTVKFKVYENFYEKDRLTTLNDDLKDWGVTKESYQALYSIPIMESWNDKTRIEAPWATEFYSTRISMASGIPMINARLSRIGVKESKRAIQFGSSKYIPKEILGLINEKAILLVYGKTEQVLSTGEQELIHVAREIHSTKEYSLYEISPSQIDSLTQSAHAQANSFCKSSNGGNILYQQGFNEYSNERVSLFDPGSLVINEEKTQYGFKIDSMEVMDQNLDLSLYLHIDSEKHNLPMIQCKTFMGQSLVEEQMVDGAGSKDSYIDWDRISFTLEKSEIDSIQLSFLHVNQNFYIDQVLLQGSQDSTCHKLTNGSYLFNNYQITEK